MEISKNTYARLYEIAFDTIMLNIHKSIKTENVDYFLESFCRVYGIDYTSISIIKNMYAVKMKATKRDIGLFAYLTNMPRTRLTIDYRTMTKYVREWHSHGFPELQPLIINTHLQPSIKAFVDAYISLMFDDLPYLAILPQIDSKEY
jgi:hypothetical protein